MNIRKSLIATAACLSVFGAQSVAVAETQDSRISNEESTTSGNEQIVELV